MSEFKKGTLEQLKLLFNGVTWDGDLISKEHRDLLVKAGLAEKCGGWNLITKKGVQYLIDLDIPKS